jgi:hypothetical protein
VNAVASGGSAPFVLEASEGSTEAARTGKRRPELRDSSRARGRSNVVYRCLFPDATLRRRSTQGRRRKKKPVTTWSRKGLYRRRQCVTVKDHIALSVAVIHGFSGIVPLTGLENGRSVLLGPDTDGGDWFTKGESKIGQTILNTRRDLVMGLTHQQPVTLQFTQGMRENLGRHTGYGLPEVGEPQRTRLQGEDDEHGPLMSEAVQSQAGWRSNFEVRMRLRGHRPTVAVRDWLHVS